MGAQMAPDASFWEIAFTGFLTVAFAQLFSSGPSRTKEIMDEDEPYEWMNKPKPPKPAPEPFRPFTPEEIRQLGGIQNIFDMALGRVPGADLLSGENSRKRDIPRITDARSDHPRLGGP